MKLLQQENARRGSVMVLVLWISFGLVALALYFADSMRFEMRAADNRVSSLAAEHAIDGAARYVSYVLSNLETNGVMPDPSLYLNNEVPLGDATFWIIGRQLDSQQNVQNVQMTSFNSVQYPLFGLVDEASKLNLNTATAAMLEFLPGMTPELAAAVVDWRDSDSDVTDNGAEDDTYQRLNPPRRCKNGRFETVEELRLVMGAELPILFGEDWNGNGVLDLNENDGADTWPYDNSDGRLDPGILEYVTVYSRESNLTSEGTNRVLISNQQQMQQLIQNTFGEARANELLPLPQNATSVLDFFAQQSRMTLDEFRQIEDQITATNATVVEGLVNVNTASETVLACIPGIGLTNAPTLVAYRQQNPDQLDTIGWVREVIDLAAARQAGPYLTGKSYQFSADIAAVGRIDRGYRRVRFVFDTTEGRPKIVLRQDLTHLGWALTVPVRENLLLTWNLSQ